MSASVRIERIRSIPTIQILPSIISASVDQLREADRIWNEMRRENPRYFNAPMLAYQTFDARTNTIRASIEQYKHHAVQDHVEFGLCLLAVTGLVHSVNEYGENRYLIGQRSPATHRYGNLYEFGPCGGIDVPADQSSSIKPSGIINELLRESKEETKMSLVNADFSPLAIVHDDDVGSVDIVVMAQIKSLPSLSTGWEYLSTKWKSLEELRAMSASDPCTLIPTTRALIDLLSE